MRLLIDTTHSQETIALKVQDNKIVDFSYHTGILSNIYIGTIAKIDLALQAVFVNFGEKKLGFLPLSNIDARYFDGPVHLRHLNPNIPLLVQVEKEERGSKGAYLTTFISLLGRYCVYMPNSDVSGISKKIQDSEHRQKLQQMHRDLGVEEGFIWRSAAVRVAFENVKKDYENVLRTWHRIQDLYHQATDRGPVWNHPRHNPEHPMGKGDSMISINMNSFSENSRLIYEDAKGIQKVLRDYYTDDIREVCVLPEHVRDDYIIDANIKPLTAKDMALFTGKQFYEAVDGLASRRINLESGGSICITQTEALIAIDINSGRSKHSAVEINEEAVRECIRQIYAKNLHGLIVIDIIDMNNAQEELHIESILKDGFKLDKARVKIQKINSLGLLELSRQRVGLSVFDYLLQNCNRCSSKGACISVGFLTRVALRELYYKLLTNRANKFVLIVPSDVGAWIVSEYMDLVNLWNKKFKTSIKLKIGGSLPERYVRVEVIS